MSNEPLYRRIPEEGKHPANSKKNPGAISGAALDDRTNRPSGTSDFVPVGITEEEYCREQRRAVFWGNIFQEGLDYATFRFERWFYTKALPKLQYEIIPEAKHKVSMWWKQRRSGEKKGTDSKEATAAKRQSKEVYTTIALSADLDGAYRNYTINMTSEEAKKELFEAFVLQYLSMKKLQRVAHARIVDIDGKMVDGADVVGKLSNPEVLRSINRMLSQSPSLLEEWQAKALSEALGRKLVQNNQFVPIRRSELITSVAENIAV